MVGNENSTENNGFFESLHNSKTLLSGAEVNLPKHQHSVENK